MYPAVGNKPAWTAISCLGQSPIKDTFIIYPVNPGICIRVIVIFYIQIRLNIVDNKIKLAVITFNIEHESPFKVRNTACTAVTLIDDTAYTFTKPICNKKSFKYGFFNNDDIITAAAAA